ncbi:MAG: hypothetical protein ACHREM_18080, partial [Polyangiales bacterium]
MTISSSGFFLGTVGGGDDGSEGATTGADGLVGAALRAGTATAIGGVSGARGPTAETRAPDADALDDAAADGDGVDGEGAAAAGSTAGSEGAALFVVARGVGSAGVDDDAATPPTLLAAMAAPIAATPATATMAAMSGARDLAIGGFRYSSSIAPGGRAGRLPALTAIAEDAVVLAGVKTVAAARAATSWAPERGVGAAGGGG